MLTALLARLRHERYETASDRNEIDLAYCKGWNDRSESLARDLPDVAPLRDLVRQHILDVVRVCNGNQTEAARKLGINRHTVRRTLRGGR